MVHERHDNFVGVNSAGATHIEMGGAPHWILRVGIPAFVSSHMSLGHGVIHSDTETIDILDPVWAQGLTAIRVPQYWHKRGNLRQDDRMVFVGRL